MFSNKMLYIPDYVVYEDIPTIIKYFEDFKIAKIKNVEICKHLEPEYYVEDKYNYGYAVIEVEFYYNNQGAQNFYSAIENNKCLMVYDDPLYWEVQFSPFPSADTSTSYAQCDCTSPTTHNVIDICDTSDTSDTSEEEELYYSSSEEEDDPKDPDYVYEESSDDDYNYETYNKNYSSFKTKQKAKKQKLSNELSIMKKTIELIKNKQEKMRLLLIHNKKSKSKDKEHKINWTRRLRSAISN